MIAIISSQKQRWENCWALEKFDNAGHCNVLSLHEMF